MSELYKRGSNVNSVEIVQMIKVKSLVGRGAPDDPVREITEFYTMDGQITSRHDLSLGESLSITDARNPQ